MLRILLRSVIQVRAPGDERCTLSLRVIGAGLGRTGTTSLRDALSTLLGERCYHFEDVIANPAHIPFWRAAIHGELTNWEYIYAGYAATTDWPGAAFWSELLDAYPGAKVLLSLRRSSSEWFESVKDTIDPLMTSDSDRVVDEWHAMTKEMLESRFVGVPFDRREAEEAYERHNALVRTSVPVDQLIEWMPGDGWVPLCEGLEVGVPRARFPHVNTKEEFRESLARATGGDDRGGGCEEAGQSRGKRPAAALLRRLRRSN